MAAVTDVLGQLRQVREQAKATAERYMQRLPVERHSYYSFLLQKAVEPLDRLIAHLDGSEPMDDRWRPYLCWLAFQREYPVLLAELMRESGGAAG